MMGSGVRIPLAAPRSHNNINTLPVALRRHRRFPDEIPRCLEAPGAACSKRRRMLRLSTALRLPAPKDQSDPHADYVNCAFASISAYASFEAYAPSPPPRRSACGDPSGAWPGSMGGGPDGTSRKQALDEAQRRSGRRRPAFICKKIERFPSSQGVVASLTIAASAPAILSTASLRSLTPWREAMAATGV